MSNFLNEIKSLKRSSKSSESPEKILMNFQEYVLSVLRTAPSDCPIFLSFTNDGKGTPPQAQMMIKQWLNRQPWAYRIKAVYLE